MPASPTDALPRPLAVAIHDAGAANIILEWFRGGAARPERIWTQGPARAAWRDTMGDGGLVDDPESLLNGAGALISGTGWASDLEHRARLEAARLGIPSVAVIDHWVNYAMRFEREGRRQLPDTIWVTDVHALAIARRVFFGARIELKPNSYLERQAAGAGPVPARGDVLFVSEPARGDWAGEPPGEFQALDHFWANRRRVPIAENTRLRLRPHPSDPAGKYDGWIAAHRGTTLDHSPDMASALAGARWVVGLNSMALVIALAAGREAISALPPASPPCILPHDDIRRL